MNLNENMIDLATITGNDLKARKYGCCLPIWALKSDLVTTACNFYLVIEFLIQSHEVEHVHSVPELRLLSVHMSKCRERGRREREREKRVGIGLFIYFLHRETAPALFTRVSFPVRTPALSSDQTRTD